MGKLFKDLIELITAGALCITCIALVLVFFHWLLQAARLDWADTSEKIELIRTINETNAKG